MVHAAEITAAWVSSRADLGASDSAAQARKAATRVSSAVSVALSRP